MIEGMSRGAWLYLLLLLSDAAWADLELHSIRLEGRNYVVAIYQPPPGRFSRVAARIVEASNTRVREAYLEHETLGPAGSGTASKLEQFLRLDERTSLVSIFRVGGDGTPDFERAQATMRVFLPDEWGQLPLDRLRKKEIANPKPKLGLDADGPAVELGNFAKLPWAPAALRLPLMRFIEQRVLARRAPKTRLLALETRMTAPPMPGKLRKLSPLIRYYRESGFKFHSFAEDPDLENTASAIMVARRQDIVAAVDARLPADFVSTPYPASADPEPGPFSSLRGRLGWFADCARHVLAGGL